MNIAVYVTSNYANYDRLSQMLSKCLRRYTTDPVILTSISKSTKPGHGNLLVKRYADENHLRCKVYETEWAKWRRSAGSIASYHMNHNSERAVVMWDGLSKGCRNFLQLARRLRRPCDLIRVNPNDGVEVPPKDIQPETPLTHGGVVRPSSPNQPVRTPPQSGTQQQMPTPGPATPRPDTASPVPEPTSQASAPQPPDTAPGQPPVQPGGAGTPQGEPSTSAQVNPPATGTATAKAAATTTQGSQPVTAPTANATQPNVPPPPPSNGQTPTGGTQTGTTTSGTPPANTPQNGGMQNSQPPASEQTIEQLSGSESED